jgi:hypothetical protein
MTNLEIVVNSIPSEVSFGELEVGEFFTLKDRMSLDTPIFIKASNREANTYCEKEKFDGIKLTQFVAGYTKQGYFSAFSNTSRVIRIKKIKMEIEV